MNEFRTSTTSVSKWLKSVQLPNEPNSLMTAITPAVLDHAPRMAKTRDKIIKLLELIGDVDSYKDSFVSERESLVEDLNLLRECISPYMIPQRETHLMGDTYYWYKTGLPDQTPDHMNGGVIWLDFLGEPAEIRESGGYILVMLSDDGVRFLNATARAFRITK